MFFFVVSPSPTLTLYKEFRSSSLGGLWLFLLLLLGEQRWTLLSRLNLLSVALAKLTLLSASFALAGLLLELLVMLDLPLNIKQLGSQLLQLLLNARLFGDELKYLVLQKVFDALSSGWSVLGLLSVLHGKSCGDVAGWLG